MLNQMSASRQERKGNDTVAENIAKAVGQQEAREALRRAAEKEKKDAMQAAITEHRESLVRTPGEPAESCRLTGEHTHRRC